MKIQELERKTGLERPSIRFYEKEGLLNPKRLENGYRDYSEDDVQMLKKIKLLRQLGLSVDKIRALQQGSEDLSAAIARQMAYHSSQIDEHRRCRAVCEAMRNDGAAFASLDAERYLKLFREVQVDNYALGRRDFQERVEKEIHPWLRFFARWWLDYSLWSAIISFIYIVILRVRPVPGEFGNALITIVGMALFIPVEALLLHKFGTTPGKFAMGIRLESIQGGNLSWEEALRRSCNVYVQGCGCCIPLLDPVLKVLNYCKLTGRAARWFQRYDEMEGPQDMVWDEETEIIYSERKTLHVVVTAVMIAAAILIGGFTAADGLKPKYRGNDLNIAEFSENYNAYMAVFNEDSSKSAHLQENGEFYPVPSNTVVININDDRNDHRMAFDYTLEGERVAAVSISYDWNSVMHLAPLDGVPLNLAYSILLAQNGSGIRDVLDFGKLIETHLNEKEARFTYQNLIVEWCIETELEMHDGILYSFGENKGEAVLFFQVTIK